MTFESLVHGDRFVSELLTKTVGQLGLPRPAGIRRRSCKVSVATTADELAQAHLKAKFSGEATMLTAIAVPYFDLEDELGATPIKPDFAIVCPRQKAGKAVGSWLIMGDAKDYERVRSRIDDGRLLKGFLQVALGAESAARWSKLPQGMLVHDSGALAVPRNAFLQPEAQVELLHDYRSEVRARAQERLKAMAELGPEGPGEAELADYIAHLEATFDPRSCSTCNLFGYCRSELRSSAEPGSLLIEIGINKPHRAAVVGLVNGTGEIGIAPASTIAQVEATATGLPVRSSRRRTDPVGLPGTINVVLAKSDGAALGVHGIAVQRISSPDPGPWDRRVFLDPQSSETRRAVMALLGSAIADVLAAGDGPIHLVVPDRPTADLLASMADSLAGVELSRLRWQRDLDMGREALTFDGEPAALPEPLGSDERLAVSFLLEEDRARAMTLRSPIVELRAVLASYMTAGGPAGDSGRLDYLVRWAMATEPLDHRVVSDEIADQLHTPGARLSNVESDEIHQAGRRRGGDPAVYAQLVTASLDYKVRVLEDAVTALSSIAESRLREVYQVLEGDAQEVWGRRLALEASDLVRFSRTHRYWRNSHVDMIDADVRCAGQLEALADGIVARDRAQDAGVRELAVARVVQTSPLLLDVGSRRIGDGTAVVGLHWNEFAMVELAGTTLRVQQGSFKFGQMPIGLLSAVEGSRHLEWDPLIPLPVEAGDELVIADLDWFGGGFRSGHEVAVKRPAMDTQAAPKPTCTPTSYATSPTDHQWCCRPHAVAEAEFSDTLATRRSRGELNPQTWPPLVDEDRFDVAPSGVTVPEEGPAIPVPVDLTLDDLD
jgi:hypothetical protein